MDRMHHLTNSSSSSSRILAWLCVSRQVWFSNKKQELGLVLVLILLYHKGSEGGISPALWQIGVSIHCAWPASKCSKNCHPALVAIQVWASTQSQQKWRACACSRQSITSSFAVSFLQFSHCSFLLQFLFCSFFAPFHIGSEARIFTQACQSYHTPWCSSWHRQWTWSTSWQSLGPTATRCAWNQTYCINFISLKRSVLTN